MNVWEEFNVLPFALRALFALTYSVSFGALHMAKNADSYKFRGRAR